MILALLAVTVPLSALARMPASSGGGEVVLVPVFGVLGFVLAWRKPANPIGWLLLGAVGFLVLSGAASAYAVADYRLRHGGLPLGWVAVLLQPGWAPAIALFGLSVLLFPDGRLPSPRWRWALWAYLAVAGLWIAGTLIISAQVIIGHHIRVDSGGNLLVIDHPVGSAAWWGTVQTSVLPAARRVLARLRGRPGDQLPAVLRRAPPAAQMAAGWICGGRGRRLGGRALLQQPQPRAPGHRHRRPVRRAGAAAVAWAWPSCGTGCMTLTG